MKEIEEIEIKIKKLKSLYGVPYYLSHLDEMLTLDEYLKYNCSCDEEANVYRKIIAIPNFKMKQELNEMFYHLQRFYKSDGKFSAFRHRNLKNYKNWKWHKYIVNSLDKILPLNYKETNYAKYNEILTDLENIYISKVTKFYNSGNELIKLVDNMMNKNNKI